MKDLIEQLYGFDNSLAHSNLSQESEIKGCFAAEEKLVKKLETLLNGEAADLFKKYQDLQMKLIYNHHKHHLI